VNGLYWHSETCGKDCNYHLNKTNLCSSLGIRLLHIFEDEITNQLDKIKNTLLNIINKSEKFENNFILDKRWNPICPNGFKIIEEYPPKFYYCYGNSRLSIDEYKNLQDKSKCYKIWDCGSIKIEKNYNSLHWRRSI
jgi:hypothetical protein